MAIDGTNNFGHNSMTVLLVAARLLSDPSGGGFKTLHSVQQAYIEKDQSRISHIFQ